MVQFATGDQSLTMLHRDWQVLSPVFSDPEKHKNKKLDMYVTEGSGTICNMWSDFNNAS